MNLLTSRQWFNQKKNWQVLFYSSVVAFTKEFLSGALYVTVLDGVGRRRDSRKMRVEVDSGRREVRFVRPLSSFVGGARGRLSAAEDWPSAASAGPHDLRGRATDPQRTRGWLSSWFLPVCPCKNFATLPTLRTPPAHRLSSSLTASASLLSVNASTFLSLSWRVYL